MKFDNYIITINNKEFIIYPLLEFSFKNENYIVYTTKINAENIFIGKIESTNYITPIENNAFNEISLLLEDIVNSLKQEQ